MYFVSTRYQDTIKDFDPTCGWWAFAPTLEEAEEIGKGFLETINYDCDTAYIFLVKENSFELVYEGFIPEPDVFWAEVD